MEGAQPRAQAQAAEAAAQRVRPRRPHHKSRNGCVQCKARKIKCGEEKPSCKKCENYGTSCSFLQTHPLHTALLTTQPIPVSTSQRPAPASSKPLTIQSMLSPEPASTPGSNSVSSIPLRPPSPLPIIFTIQDLELLHFYTTTYTDEFFDDPNLVQIYRTVVVELAVEYPFLMHELLSVAAQHLALTRPHKRSIYLHASDTHANTALTLFQPEISNLTDQNCHACFAFSTMLYTQAWVSQDVNKPSRMFFAPSGEDGENVHIQWINLQRGSMALLKSSWPVLSNGPLAAMFVLWKDVDPNREDSLLEADEKRFQELAEAWAAPDSVSDNERAYLEGALRQTKRVFSMLTFFPDLSKLVVIMTWFSQASDGFLEMLERKVPQALLIVVTFCVALQRLESVWWMKGKAENLLQTMLDALGPGWERWTRWPIEKVFHGQLNT